MAGQLGAEPRRVLELRGARRLPLAHLPGHADLRGEAAEHLQPAAGHAPTARARGGGHRHEELSGPGARGSKLRVALKGLKRLKREL